MGFVNGLFHNCGSPHLRVDAWDNWELEQKSNQSPYHIKLYFNENDKEKLQSEEELTGFEAPSNFFEVEVELRSLSAVIVGCKEDQEKRDETKQEKQDSVKSLLIYNNTKLHINTILHITLKSEREVLVVLEGGGWKTSSSSSSLSSSLISFFRSIIFFKASFSALMFFTLGFEFFAPNGRPLFFLASPALSQ